MQQIVKSASYDKIFNVDFISIEQKYFFLQVSNQLHKRF
jgi:hypothetical protein